MLIFQGVVVDYDKGVPERVIQTSESLQQVGTAADGRNPAPVEIVKYPIT